MNLFVIFICSYSGDKIYYSYTTATQLHSMDTMYNMDNFMTIFRMKWTQNTTKYTMDNLVYNFGSVGSGFDSWLGH
jgi:hypothetical protein